MSNLIDCKECGHSVAKSAKTCPNCGVDKPGKHPPPPPTTSEQVVTFIILALIIGGVYFWMRETPEERQARIAEESRIEEENRQAGFHCLSSLNGSHRLLARAVQESLRNPDSFEHIETRITPVDSNGEHLLFMEYRATNGFGGVTTGLVTASVSNSDCGITILTND
tara:strand:- start:395263 stop:395763 length:501 start_codon:yes stop_codon:yes gene_type:complete